MRFFLMIAILSGITTAAFGFDHADRTTLAAELQRIEADMEAGRYAAVADRRPPLLPAMPEIPEDVRYLDVRFDLASTDIRTTTSGVDYAIFPTRTTLSRGLGADLVSDSLTLAYQDAGRWYVVDLASEDDVSALVSAYPAFATIEFPNFKETP